MSEQAIERIIIAVIAAVPPTIMALAAYLASKQNRDKLYQIRRDINGRLTELIDAKAKAAVLEDRDKGSGRKDSDS